MKHKWQEGDLFVVTKYVPIIVVGVVKRVAPTLTGESLQADVSKYIRGRLSSVAIDEYYDVAHCEPLTTTAAAQEVTEFPSPLTGVTPEAEAAAHDEEVTRG